MISRSFNLTLNELNLTLYKLNLTSDVLTLTLYGINLSSCGIILSFCGVGILFIWIAQWKSILLVFRNSSYSKDWQHIEVTDSLKHGVV